ncbi:MAG: 2',5' RNA ligase family [Syntrophaceae bacterium PtaU1.Bin231]|nr:MAG: 2',5' RNA ligase family [Syntrophaceae bacterium PtaU1.Bin231]HOG16951.1 RNA 2',3'-cyclic phosphodiesterase [Syntrophales bacterium]
MAGTGSVRAFLAADPPPEVLDRIAAIQRELKKTVQGSIAWVRPEGIHLTLKFFGNISPEQAQTIATEVRKAVSGTAALSLRGRSLGVFPDLRRPRVIWLGLEGDVEPLGALQKRIETGLESCGFAREERPFRAHLTLGRIKDGRGLVGLEQALKGPRLQETGDFVVDKLTLFRSELTPKGAIYTGLATFPFAGG